MSKSRNQNQRQQPQKREKQASWTVIRGLLTCRDVQVQQQQKQAQPEENSKKCKKMRCSGSLCNNTKVMDDVHKKRVSSMNGACNNNESNASSRISMKAPQNQINGIGSLSSSSSNNSSISGGSFRGMPFRKLSGCYECRTVVDPVLGFTRDPSMRGTIWSCPDCDEIFMKAESLEHHQAVKHASMFPFHIFQFSIVLSQKFLIFILWLVMQTLPLSNSKQVDLGSFWLSKLIKHLINKSFFFLTKINKSFSITLKTIIISFL